MKPCSWIVALICCLGLLFSGCAPISVPQPVPEKTRLAVAGFSVPDSSRELFAESRLPELKSIDSDILAALDESLAAELEARNREPYQGMASVKQCREIVLQEQAGKRLQARDYWTLVGRCIPAEFLLIPQLLEWRERQGDQWAVQQPAKVVFNLYLLDVQKGEVHRRYHFEKEQEALSENLLTLSRFFKREGKWITARALAAEGIAEGLTELGL